MDIRRSIALQICNCNNIQNITELYSVYLPNKIIKNIYGIISFFLSNMYQGIPCENLIKTITDKGANQDVTKELFDISATTFISHFCKTILGGTKIEEVQKSFPQINLTRMLCELTSTPSPYKELEVYDGLLQGIAGSFFLSNLHNKEFLNLFSSANAAVEAEKRLRRAVLSYKL